MLGQEGTLRAWTEKHHGDRASLGIAAEVYFRSGWKPRTGGYAQGVDREAPW